MIHLEDVRLELQSRAGPVEILRGANLDVGDGEAVAILGPSGSGKSTLLMVIAGLEQPNAGRVEVHDQDLIAMGEDDLAGFRRDHVGIVFQSFHLVAAMTALENVAVPLELGGVDNAFERARAALVAVGLEARLEHYPAQLSGGEQQRVAIARAFANRPKLILADEPVSSLDPSTSKQIMDLLEEFNQRDGVAVICNLHLPSLAREYGSRIIALNEGQIVYDGPATDLSETELNSFYDSQ
ncbi:MAG: ABC transporter ATP-binding protein [Rhodospirillales bacterium]|nr:ABC transporter ATP-binding protein [Rhodospirillales bacterium]